MSTSIYYKNPDDELDFNGHKKNIVVIPNRKPELNELLAQTGGGVGAGVFGN